MSNITDRVAYLKGLAEGMKLSDEFLLTPMGEGHVLVPVGRAADRFHGVVKLNETAAFIVRQLQSETDPERIVDAMAAEYEGTREQFAAGVEQTLTMLRKCGALCE